MENIVWQPQPRQLEFMRRPEDEALYGGAAGGGKSDALVIEATRQVHIPHYKALILRKTFPQLTELIEKSMRYYPMAFPKARYNVSEHTWYFPSGAKIVFGSMHHPKDKLNYQGKSYDFIAFDELTHFTYEEYIYLSSRNRANGPGTKVYMRATANPGGIGHGWVKERFITAAEPMTTMWDTINIEYNGKVESRHRSRIFVPSSVFDNKILLENDPDYLTRLASMPEAERKALLYGDWESYSGQYFTEWRDKPEHYIDRKFTNVIEPFEIPDHWKIYRSYDFGYSKPFSCGWWAVDEEGVVYRILELYGCTKTPDEGIKWTPQQQFEEIHRIETEHRWLKGKNIQGVADPAIWKAETGESIADVAARNQVYFTKGDNERISGWMQMHYRLSFDENGYPMMYVFKNCKAFIRTIPLLQYDEHKVEDVDTKGEDHCLVGDTQVLTDEGYKPLESLVGTEGMVMSHDGKYHRYYDVRLTRKQADIYAIELEDGTKIYCTDDHRFMLPNGEWIHTKNLLAGMEIKTYGCFGRQYIKSITYAGKADVFNMEVEDTHNFVIQGGVISHNCADETRYFLMTRPIKPRKAVKPDEFEKNPLKLFLDIKKEDIRAREKRPGMTIIREGD